MTPTTPGVALTSVMQQPSNYGGQTRTDVIQPGQSITYPAGAFFPLLSSPSTVSSRRSAPQRNSSHDVVSIVFETFRFSSSSLLYSSSSFQKKTNRLAALAGEGVDVFLSVFPFALSLFVICFLKRMHRVVISKKRFIRKGGLLSGIEEEKRKKRGKRSSGAKT